MPVHCALSIDSYVELVVKLDSYFSFNNAGHRGTIGSEIELALISLFYIRARDGIICKIRNVEVSKQCVRIKNEVKRFFRNISCAVETSKQNFWPFKKCQQ